MTVHRGDVLPDMDTVDEDGWLVVAVWPRMVWALDMVYLVCWEWRTDSDGIRVKYARTTPRDSRHDTPETEWVVEAINAYPPPPAIADHLRGAP